jgi:hypothetical protein
MVLYTSNFRNRTMGLFSLFKKLVLFLLPVLFFACITEIILYRIPNDLSFKLQQFRHKSGNITALVLGGSHAYYDLDPAEISPEVFNMAYVSQSLEFDYQLLNKCIGDIPNLKTVVLDISYVSLSQRWNETEVSWRKFNYYKYYGIIPPVGPKIQKYVPDLFLIPLKQSLIKLVKYFRGENLITCTENGWCNNYHRNDRVKDLEADASLAAIRHENGSLDFTPGIACLNRIIDLCREHHLKVVIISFPVTPEYLRHQNRVKYTKIFDTCSAIANRYSFVDYYNYSEDPRMKREDFYDSDHLIDMGAMKFSAILKKEVFADHTGINPGSN